MKKTKSIFLFLILILPVLLYLFLQGFGKNQFAIPIYFQSGIVTPLEGCESSVSGQPYQLNEAALNVLVGEKVSPRGITVYELGNSDSDKLRNNMYTFLEKYKGRKDITLVSIRAQRDTLFTPSRYDAWKRFNLPDSNLMKLGRCILQLDLNSQMKADSGLVLVDQNRQIRGYYDPMILKEIDRLNTELFILLSD
ncbi:hypothetical protein SAMN04488029_1503 [Reichenbachiella faecimaris]|uniref:Uncharacterized protein n=1 Tax=Reichenbachiella faecimaris TaxID=692418 RepID=A0A1W2G9V6_REIFA|nr:hypothetical protein [Reichenbachiella faecimaris]SMD33138.1 hypothetical protein SAMN04488029_1503 [Reichenbachiella faecimaris]